MTCGKFPEDLLVLDSSLSLAGGRWAAVLSGNGYVDVVQADVT